MNLSVCLVGHSRPILSALVFERIKEILNDYNYEVIFAYDRSPERPCDCLINIVNSIFDVKHVLINKNHTYLGGLYNKAFDLSSGDYYIFIENDWFWRTDRIEESINALEEVDFVRMVKRPFHNFKAIKNGYCLPSDGTDFVYNFNPHIRKEKFLIGRFPEELKNIGILERYATDKFVEMDKKSAILDSDSFSHVGFVNSDGFLRLQHFKREEVYPSIHEAVNWFKTISPSKYYNKLFELHLLSEVRGVDKGVDYNEIIRDNIL